MSKEQIILITLLIYIVLLIALGFFGSRRTQNNSDLFIGGRTLGPFVASMSYVASSASAWVLLGLSGMAYAFGISVIWVVPGLLLGHSFSWYWVAPRLQKLSHKHQLVTVTDLIAIDGSEKTKSSIKKFTAATIIFCFMFYIAAQLQAAGGTFAITFDLPLSYSILIGGLVIMCYTMVGGFWAVSLTDTLQGSLMILASVALPALALMEVGGVSHFWQAYSEIATVEQLSLFGGNSGFVLLGFMVGSLSIGVSVLGQPHLLARFMSLKTGKSVRPARMIALSCFVVSFLGMVLLGLCGKIMVSDLANREDIFFILTDDLMPAILGAIMIAAVLSAILSTADSQILVSASSIAHDLMGESDQMKSKLLISRVVIVVLCLLSVSIALFIPSDIFSRVLFAWNALGATIGPVVLMRLSNIDINPRSILPAMSIALALVIVFFIMKDAPGDFMERVVPHIISFTYLYLTRKK